MKTLAVLSNTVLVVVAGLIVVTEGLPRRPFSLAFTLLIVLVPALTLFAIARRTPAAGRAVRVAAAASSLFLLGCVCWALVVQYPYPEGAGVIPFGALALLAPVAGLAALRRFAPFTRTPRT